MEDRDVLNQIKPSHPRPAKKSKYTGLILIVFGIMMIYFIGDLIFGDNRMVFLYPDGKTVESRGDFNDEGVGIGKHTYYRINGTKKHEWSYDDHGKLHGKSLMWNSKEQMISSTNYVHGLRDGESKTWNDEGQLLEHEIYKNDSLIKKIK